MSEPNEERMRAEVVTIPFSNEAFVNLGKDLAAERARADEAEARVRELETLLPKARELLQRWYNEIIEGGGLEYCGIGTMLDRIDKATEEAPHA